MKDIKKFLIFAFIIILIDLPWIKYVMADLYESVFEMKINKVSAVIAYTLMIVPYIFIISKHSFKKQLFYSFIFGLTIYGTYGFTLAAINEKYPIKLALIETLWGITLFVTTTYLTNYFTN